MELLPEWQTNIKNFEICYKTLGSSITPKIHSIFFEIPRFIKKHNMPLGRVSEQKFEHVHSDIKPTLARYKRAPNSPDYAKKREDSIVCYNGANV